MANQGLFMDMGNVGLAWQNGKTVGPTGILWGDLAMGINQAPGKISSPVGWVPKRALGKNR